MRSLVREPLLHFLLLGTALFAAYGWLDRAEARPDEIVVGAGQIEHLAETFSRFQQRAPSADELKEQVDRYVREEILSREAVKLGLDQDDTVIRRRLQQKLEFIAADVTGAVEPTEDELAAWLAAHPDDYREEARLSFRQVCLIPDRHGDRLDADVAALLAALRQAGATAAIGALGDGVLLPQEIADASSGSVAAQFGQPFMAQLAGLPLGEWSGPVPSGYGVHAVLVTASSDGRLPALDDVRARVARDVLTDRRHRAEREFMDGLLTKYQVRIEWPEADSQAKGAP
jgi:hypothetical protein